MMDTRQAPCGVNGNTDTICSPQKGEIWQNNTWHQISWNPSYPTYAADEIMSIYLYYVKNYQNTMVKSWTHIEPTRSNYPVFVDDSWYPPAFHDDGIHEAFIYIVGGNVDPDEEMTNRYSDYPAPIPIQVVGQKETTVLATNETGLNDVNHQKSSNNDGGGGSVLQPWVIAIVVVACIAALAACIIMVWAIRHVRRRKLVFDEKGHVEIGGISGPVMTTTAAAAASSLPGSSIMYPGSSFKNDSSFILPPTAMDGSIRSHHNHHHPQSLSSRIMLDRGNTCLPDNNMIFRPQSVASCSNISTLSITDTPPISSADALMIADTFRQRMRRPEWQQQQLQEQQQEHEEESKRRQLSEELLKKELAAEGTLMKKVGKRAQLLSAFSDDDDDEDGKNNRGGTAGDGENHGGDDDTPKKNSNISSSSRPS